MTLYDSFSRDGGSVPRHRFRIGKAAREDMPALNKDVKFTAPTTTPPCTSPSASRSTC